ncbi:MAG TPA: MFS transporter [Bordetella sp.]
MAVSNTGPDAASGPLPAAFRHLLLTRMGSSFAYQIVSVALGWQVYAMTGNPLDLGLIGLAQFLPMLVLTLFVGQAADRYNRRAIVAICLTVEACAALALGASALTGTGGRGLLYGLVVLMSIARAFESPTLPTLLPALVPRASIARGTAMFTSANQAAQILGPALGGVGYGLGAGWVYCVAALLFLLAMLSIVTVAVPHQARRNEVVTLGTFFAGIKFIFQRRILLGTLSLDLFSVLLGGATALLPIYAKDILHAGPWALGLLRASPACGAILMSLALARHSLRGHIGRQLFSALLVFGLATVVFGLSRSIPLSIFALATIGAADSLSMVVRGTLVQLNTPNEMLGRVSAVNMLFVGTSNQLGEFESGLTAALLGAVPAVIVGGVGTIVVTLLWMWWFPELRRLRSLQ